MATLWHSILNASIMKIYAKIYLPNGFLEKPTDIRIEQFQEWNVARGFFFSSDTSLERIYELELVSIIAWTLNNLENAEKQHSILEFDAFKQQCIDNR